MSDPKDKKEPAAKKSGGGKVGVIIIAVFVCVSSTAGAVFGQVALAKMKPAEKEKVDAGYEEKEEPLAVETMIAEPLIVDLRTAEGELHHIKVGFAIELAKPVPEEEQKKLMVRAKDAAISYMRTLSYDEVTAQEKFEGIKKELGERISKALGRGRVAHVLFTEFVVQ
jgi:flagellar basal body-associated protein FliL